MTESQGVAPMAFVGLLVAAAACGTLQMPNDQARQCLSLVLEVRTEIKAIAAATLTDRRIIETDLEWWSYGSRIANPENDLRYAVPYVYGDDYYIAECNVEGGDVVLLSLGRGRPRRADSGAPAK